MFAFCRSHAIRNIQYLQAQSRHAKRQDRSSQARIRPDAKPTSGLSWVRDMSSETDRRDYLSAYKRLKASKGASERRGAQIGIHILVGVSPEWVREAGDLHDPKNPRNTELILRAMEWANSWSNDGCYAARIDLDETGGAVVDLFVAPTAQQKHKAGKSKLTVSVNKCLDELAMKHRGKQGRHYSALNDSWAQYAQEHLDPRLQRGKPRAESGKSHVPPDAYRAMMQEAEAKLSEAQERERALQAQAADLAAQRDMLANQEGHARRIFARVKRLLEQMAVHIGIEPKDRMMETLVSIEQEVARLAPAVSDPFSSAPQDPGPEGPGL